MKSTLGRPCAAALARSCARAARVPSADAAAAAPAAAPRKSRRVTLSVIAAPGLRLPWILLRRTREREPCSGRDEQSARGAREPRGPTIARIGARPRNEPDVE